MSALFCDFVMIKKYSAGPELLAVPLLSLNSVTLAATLHGADIVSHGMDRVTCE